LVPAFLVQNEFACLTDDSDLGARLTPLVPKVVQHARRILEKHANTPGDSSAGFGGLASLASLASLAGLGGMNSGAPPAFDLAGLASSVLQSFGNLQGAPGAQSPNAQNAAPNAPLDFASLASSMLPMLQSMGGSNAPGAHSNPAGGAAAPAFDFAGLASSVLGSLGGAPAPSSGMPSSSTHANSNLNADHLNSNLNAGNSNLNAGDVNSNLNATVVESSPGNFSSEANKYCVQTWTILNTGSSAWPKGTKVIFVRGDREISVDEEFPVSEASVGPVQLQAQLQVAATLLAPNKNGRYSAYFKLADADRNVFGPLLSVTVEVCGGVPVQTETPADPKVRFAAELSELRSMGFYDQDELAHLLVLNNGSIQNTLNQLL